MQREVIEEDLTKAEVWELIQTLVYGKVAPSRILELYYWSLEPGALEMLRSYLLLSKENRAALQTFFNSVAPRSVSIKAVAPGQLLLTASDRTSRPNSIRDKTPRDRERARSN